jgi:arylsulfatase A-like enzyme
MAPLLLAILGACGRGESVELWRRPAERWEPVARLALASETAAPLLGQGWSPNPGSDPGGPFLWALGRQAELRLALPSNAQGLALEAKPPPGGPGRPQRLRFQLDGLDLGERSLDPGWSRLEVPLPPALEPGQHRLVLEADWSLPPSEAEPRPLAFRARALEVLAPGPPPPQPPGPELSLAATREPAIRLAGGAAWNIPLQAPGAALLEFEMRRRAGGPVELRLMWEDAAGLRELGRYRPSWAISRHRLVPLDARGPGRLVLTCAGGWDAIVELRRARLHVAAPERRTPDAVAAGLSGPRPRNLVIYLLDALRADALGSYGSPLGHTPHLDRLVRGGRLFRRLLGHSAWTRPSVATLFTGLAPWTHRTQARADVLPEAAATLAERFAQAGWFTGAVLTNGNASRVFGLAQGFGWTIESFRLPGVSPLDPDSMKLRSDRLGELAWQGLDAAGNKPFFLYLHAVDTHDPYSAPAPLDRLDAPGPGGQPESELQAQRRRYRAAVHANDEQIGALLAGLERRGLLGSTLLVFLADHGEEFGEHGRIHHGHGLSGEIVHLPLVLSGPGVLAGIEPEALEMCDLAPSLLVAMGLEGSLPGGALDGRVVDLLGGGSVAPPPRRAHVAQEMLERPPLGAILDGRYKLVQQGPALSLYDVAEDPAEQHDLSADLPFVARALHAELLLATTPDWALPRQSIDESQLDRQVEEQLRALGYLK